MVSCVALRFGLTKPHVNIELIIRAMASSASLDQLKEKKTGRFYGRSIDYIFLSLDFNLSIISP